MAEKGIAEETYDESKTALFRVQGTSPHNMQAIQVDTVSLALVCFLRVYLKRKKTFPSRHFVLAFYWCTIVSSNESVSLDFYPPISELHMPV